MSQTFDRRDRQRGAALIVGLVLMTVLTLLAVSTMRTSTLELAMAGNAQYHEQATQLAEAGIADAVSRVGVTITLQNTPDWEDTSIAETVLTGGGNNLGAYNVTIRYLNECGDPPAGVSKGNKGLQADYFEIESTGMSAARNARSTIRQGFWLPAIACL